MYVERMRSQTLHAFSQLNGGIRNGNGTFSGTDLAYRAGGTDTILRGQLVGDGPSRLDADLAAAAAAAAYRPPPCGVATQVLRAVDIILRYYARINMPPTRCARGMYILFQGIASAYNWCSLPVAITGTKDGWNWDIKYSLSTESDQAVFITACCHTILGALVAGYSPSTLDEGLTPQQRAVSDDVKGRGGYGIWVVQWLSWWTGRQNDGSTEASTPPPVSDYPNGATRLDVSQTQDFTNTTAYPNPDKWTPLVVGGAFKPYLTQNWNSVRSTGISTNDESTIKSAANTKKLTDPTARTQEVNALFTLSQALTDEQKVIAEFWAGGPSTPSPPGIAVWIWRVAMEALAPSPATVVFSGLDLGIGLFETSRLIWGLKAQWKEARPIQEIRRLHAGETALQYDGTPISASLWVPYQMPNFVTPPFPDFPSGHSGFSQMMANVMTRWFGSTVPTNRISVTAADTVAPLLPPVALIQLSEFQVSMGASEIQPGVVPATSVNLVFPTWQHMAESAGVSRQYGGIHCVSAHLGGQTVANELYPLLQNYWGIQVI